MIPYFNVIILSIIMTFNGFVLGMIVFSSKHEHDFEQDYDETCSDSKHLFANNKTDSAEIYCFCGNEVLRPNDNPHYFIIKT